MDLSEKLIELYPKMERYARSLVDHKDKAEDLVMEVITRLLERASSLSDQVNVEAYAMRAVKNYFLDEYRKSQRTQSEMTEDGESIFEQTPDELSEHQVSSAVVGSELEIALNSVGENCKEILVLFGIGNSYKEIAAIVDISMGTVMSRMSRCRESLHTKMYG
jgi:RNA polymerase sigma-70 factor (ECF subfamily)